MCHQILKTFIKKIEASSSENFYFDLDNKMSVINTYLSFQFGPVICIQLTS